MPARVFIQIGWSSFGQSIRKSYPVSFRRSGVRGSRPSTAPSSRAAACPKPSRSSRDVLEEAPLVGLPHAAMPLGIGAAVPDELVAARLQRIDDLRRVVEHRGVDQVRGRQVQFVEQLEAAPHAHAVAVVAPRKGARIGRRVGDGEQMALACAEGEMLDVEAEIDRESLAARPGVVRAFGDRRIG